MVTERDIDVAIVEAQRQAGLVMRQFLADWLGRRAARHPLLMGQPIRPEETDDDGTEVKEQEQAQQPA